jgi:hypothetical protein
MAIVTIEDLQGTIEVVVFPRLYETTRATWRDGAILLIAGRVDHRGEEASVLADLVQDWDDAAALGPEAFARDVAAGDRGSRGRPGNGRGGYANGNGNGAPRPMVAVGPGAAPVPVAAGAGGIASGAEAPPVAFVSPLRVDAEAAAAAPETISALPPIAPAEPVSAYVEADSVAALAPDRDQEPAVPDEARERIVAAATADAPLAAGPDAILHVRFAGSAGSERVVSAMELVKTLLRDRPGATRVVIHVPASGAGEALPMELRRGVAYDAELLAEVQRRLGDGLVELRLAQA